jgi:CheY-like chemotaxis protein
MEKRFDPTADQQTIVGEQNPMRWSCHVAERTVEVVPARWSTGAIAANIAPVRPAIRVLVTDDHAEYRHAIGSLLSLYDEIEVVCEAASVDETLIVLSDQIIDLVLMDVNMPGTNGVEGAAKLLAVHPDAHIMLCSTSERDHLPHFVETEHLQFTSKADLDPDELLQWCRTWHIGTS